MRIRRIGSGSGLGANQVKHHTVLETESDFLFVSPLMNFTDVVLISIDNGRALARRDTEVHSVVTVWLKVTNEKGNQVRTWV